VTSAPLTFPESMLDAALQYAARGWRVFPLGPKSKHPLVPKSSGGNGCHDGTTDQAQIRGWWGSTPDAGIGLHCGPGSGVVVLDVDAGKGGPEALVRLESAFGALPLTLVSSTGGGGKHYFFRADSARPIKNRVAIKGPDGARILGLDVRSEGGYVVLPPSAHPSGGTYRWHFDDDLAEMPGWLLDLIDPPKAPRATSPAPLPLPTPDTDDRDRRYVSKALDRAADNIRTAPEGHRNDTANAEAFAIGGWLPGGLLDRGTAEFRLIDAAMACGLEPREARDVITRALDAGSNSPRQIPGRVGLQAIYDVAREAQTNPNRQQAKLSAIKLVGEQVIEDLAVAAKHRPRELDEALGTLAAVAGMGQTAEKVGRRAASRAKEIEQEQEREASRTRAESDPASDPDARPEIVVTSAEASMVAESARILALRASEVYVRGGELVRVKVDEHGRCTIESTPEAEMRRLLSLHVNWVRVKRDPDTKEVTKTPTSPPIQVAKQIASLPEYRDFRALIGVASTPILRHDGTIVAASGYDPASKWLLRIPDTLQIDVAERPDRDTHVADAVALLLDLVREFPFASDGHRSGALAYLLTLVARTYFDGPAPLFLVTGSTAGAGKGLLVRALGYVAHGSLPDNLPYSADEDETRKRVTSILAVGARAVNLDNIPNGAKLGNAILDSLMTTTEWTDRPLGSTSILRLIALAVWSATGNNIGVRGDMVRRTIPIRLEPDEERPEERAGLRDLMAHVKANRTELLAAALTILRGYIAAGLEDVGVPNLGSFEGWSVIRRAIVWAGQPDPCGPMVEFRDLSDDKAEELDAILNGFEQAFRGAKASASEIAHRFSDPLDAADLQNPLADLLRSRCMTGRSVNAQKVGNLLGKYRDTWRGRRRLVVQKSGGVPQWSISERGAQ
jgi:hypothetical protein